MIPPNDPPLDGKKQSTDITYRSMARGKKGSDKNIQTLGQALRMLRKSRGYTLQLLADRTGTHVGNLSRIERDLSRPGLDLLFRLADAMNYSMATLFSFTDMSTDLDEEQSTLLAIFMTLPRRDRELLVDIARLMQARLRPSQEPPDSDVGQPLTTFSPLNESVSEN